MNSVVATSECYIKYIIKHRDYWSFECVSLVHDNNNRVDLLKNRATTSLQSYDVLTKYKLYTNDYKSWNKNNIYVLHHRL